MDGAVVRTLAFQAGSIPAWYPMWVEFAAGSRIPRGFSSGSPAFLSPQKETLELIQIPIRPG